MLKTQKDGRRYAGDISTFSRVQIPAAHHDNQRKPCKYSRYRLARFNFGYEPFAILSKWLILSFKLEASAFLTRARALSQFMQSALEQALSLPEVSFGKENLMAGPTGIEPATPGLKVRCSSLTELRTHLPNVVDSKTVKGFFSVSISF